MKIKKRFTNLWDTENPLYGSNCSGWYKKYIGIALSLDVGRVVEKAFFGTVGRTFYTNSLEVSIKIKSWFVTIGQYQL